MRLRVSLCFIVCFVVFANIAYADINIQKYMPFFDITWYCDCCLAVLNSQDGFDIRKDVWLCKRCGYENSITDAAIVDNGREYRPTLLLGHYEQDNNGDNGPEPIEWIVLVSGKEKAFLISKFIIDWVPYIKDDETTVTEWLNDAFIRVAFSDEERQFLLDENGNTPESSSDRVFLFTSSRDTQYFRNKDVSSKTIATRYARAKGAGNGNTDWWLKSDGTTDKADIINAKGKLQSTEKIKSHGIRPAIWINLAQLNNAPEAIYYEKGAVLQKNVSLEKAAELFDKCGTYMNSERRAKQCRYALAQRCVEKKEFEKACDLYQACGTFYDSQKKAEQYREFRYGRAVDIMEKGDYKTAAELFDQLGEYKDSTKNMLTCFGKIGVPVYYFGPHSIQWVNAGTKAGYTERKEISGSDVHFQYPLGEFFLTGFTSVDYSDPMQPVFYKNPGDKPALRFWLKCDIDRMFGNSQISVNDENNAFDEELYRGMGKGHTRFGRGALICRKTLDNGKTTVDVVCQDYLLARHTTPADTALILNNPGLYEVALDYELKTKGISDKYARYSIRLTFKVKNESTMFFMRDLNGRELKNMGVTQNGLKIDLAESQAIQIKYQRLDIVRDEKGRLEFDPRVEQGASDGHVIKEAGIYRIKGYNKDAHESTTGGIIEKIVFIGDETTDANELRDTYYDIIKPQGSE